MGRKIGWILRLVELFVGKVGNEIDLQRVGQMRIRHAPAIIPACFSCTLTVVPGEII